MIPKRSWKLFAEDFKHKVATGGIVYWMNEQSGRMAQIVKKFFSDEEDLALDEIDILKLYIDQWVDAMPIKPPNWREKLAKCKTKKDLRDYNWMLVSEYAIDPF